MAFRKRATETQGEALVRLFKSDPGRTYRWRDLADRLGVERELEDDLRSAISNVKRSANRLLRRAGEDLVIECGPDGLYKLCDEFDETAAYARERRAKVAATLITTAQVNLGTLRPEVRDEVRFATRQYVAELEFRFGLPAEEAEVRLGVLLDTWLNGGAS